MNTVTPEQFASIHNEAMINALLAARLYFTSELNSKDQFPCGFAWVKVDNVKLSTKLGKAMKSCGFDAAYGGGISLWNPSDMHVQNVDVKYAGADAYAAVLRKYGIDAYAAQRWD